MIPWAKMASDFDSNPKIIKAGFLGGAVYLFLLRRNALMGSDGVLPDSCIDPEYVASQLRCSVEEAATGCNACNVAGLVSVADGCVAIIGWEEWSIGGGRKPLTSTERSRKHREKTQVATVQRDATLQPLHATQNATATLDQRRREEIRVEEKREREPSPSAPAAPQGPPALALVPSGAPKAKRKAPLPADWRPKADHAAIAKEHGKDLELEVERMRDWDAAGGPGSKDWDASFRNWLRRKDFGGGPRGSPPPRDPRVGYSPARPDSHTTPDGIVRTLTEL
jgi:hypothetical protein